MDLKVVRFLHGMNQSEFAKACGLWQPRVSVIEAGATRPSKVEREKLDYFLKRSPISLSVIEFVEREVENAKSG